MATKIINIDNVLLGQTPTVYFGAQGQYLASIGIDPDMPAGDGAISADPRASGLLRPTAMAKFSGTEITGVPLWFVSNPKDTNTYLYANDGKCHLVTSALAMGTALNSGNPLTTSSGNGAAYYDNYLYLARNLDVARYGPLNGSPSLTLAYWSGLSLTALTNTIYPSINGVAMPNHVMHRHTDDKLYFTDVTSGNQGIISYIKTSKTTVEGDTNNGSTYNALDFDHGVYPTAIETYGDDLAIATIEGINTTIRQGNAQLSFWDTTSASFTKITSVEFPDPLITALKNVNGILYVFSGNASGGCRISRFVGGYSFEEVAYFDDSLPPFHGAVDHFLNRIIWGGFTTYPETSACVYSFGSKRKDLPMGIQTPFKASSSGANPMVTTVKYIQHASNVKRFPIIGWSDDSAKGLDKSSTTYGVSVWRSSVFRIGQPFKIKNVIIPLAQAVAANMTLIPKIYFDDASSNTALRTINNTNYPNSERQIIDRTDGLTGKNNFFLELRWSGTALLTVNLPILIEIETENF